MAKRSEVDGFIVSYHKAEIGSISPTQIAFKLLEHRKGTARPFESMVLNHPISSLDLQNLLDASAGACNQLIYLQNQLIYLQNQSEGLLELDRQLKPASDCALTIENPHLSPHFAPLELPDTSASRSPTEKGFMQIRGVDPESLFPDPDID